MEKTLITCEICVDSIDSAIAAAEGGATRIELCSSLNDGGLTPTVGVLKTLKSIPLNIPIYCMLRPRSGNDFLYNSNEMDAVLNDLDLLRNYGADGFVFGALTAKREINIKQCQQVIRKSFGLPVTFHRAFDLTERSVMDQTVQTLINLEFKHLLTSGYQSKAEQALEVLTELVRKYQHSIQIIPASGINIHNLEKILKTTKCTQFHSSAKLTNNMINQDLPMANDGHLMSKQFHVAMGKNDIRSYEFADVNVVRKLVMIANSINKA